MGPAPAASAGEEATSGLTCDLAHLTDRLARLDLEGLADDRVDQLLVDLRRPLQQLESLRARAAALSQARALARAGGAPSGATVREHQRRLAIEQQLTPSEVSQQIEAGRPVRDRAATAEAVVAGDVDTRHAQRIAQVLRVVPDERRAEVEAELLDLAGRLDALAFGRAARRILARERPAALAKEERRQHLDRSLRATDTEDGGFAFSGLLYGIAAERVRTALKAFRRPDTPDELRTPEQRGADAFEQLCAASLRSGDAPTQHGVRPQVMAIFTAEQFAALQRMPELTSGVLGDSGQVASGRELRSLTADCDLFRVVVDAKGTHIEVSTTVRTVPVGLWRALLACDGGCVWEGCDAPASWCDVAHGDEAFASGGRLSVADAMLLCRSHHRRFDHGPYRAAIIGDQVTIRWVASQETARREAGPGPGSSTPGTAATPHPSIRGSRVIVPARAPRPRSPGSRNQRCP